MPQSIGRAPRPTRTRSTELTQPGHQSAPLRQPLDRFLASPAGPGSRTAVTLGEADGRPVLLGARGVTVGTVGQLARLVDQAAANPFRGARLPQNVLAQLADDTATLFGATEATRSAAATVLLSLIESLPPGSAQSAAIERYATQLAREPRAELAGAMAYAVVSSPGPGDSPAWRALRSQAQLAVSPPSPPYDAWFGAGPQTLRTHVSVGGSEFLGGFLSQLQQAGFVLEADGKTLTRTDEVNGVQTRHQVVVDVGARDSLAAMSDPAVQVVAYDGHANYGRNPLLALSRAPLLADGGEGKLLFINLCVGKGVLDAFREKYPRAQIVTTFATSWFSAPGGQMTNGEGVQAFLQLLGGVSAREPWPALHEHINRGAFMRSRTWDNYLTPEQADQVARRSDLDDDGQEDHLDRLYDMAVRPARSSARWFEPLRQPVSASRLEGTAVYYAAEMANRLSETNQVLARVNPDSQAASVGYFEPLDGTQAPVRWTRVDGRLGPELQLAVNARYAHMSEEALRAVSMYELIQQLTATSELALSHGDAVLLGLTVVAKSLSVDNGNADDEVWRQFLTAWQLPPALERATFAGAIEASRGYTSGSLASVTQLKERLGPDVLRLLASPPAGVFDP